MNKAVIYKEDAIKLLDDLENRIAEEEGWQEKCDGVFQAKELIANMITIEAEPVRHGQWIKGHGMMPPEYFGRHKCSLCGHFALSRKIGHEELSNYCPNCGAKMDLGKD